MYAVLAIKVALGLDEASARTTALTVVDIDLDLQVKCHLMLFRAF